MPTISELRKRKKLSQAALAKLTGTSQPQINRLEKNERELTKEWAMRLAPALGATARDILFPESERLVSLVGYVGADSSAHYFYADAQGPFDEVSAPDYATEKTVAVEVRGDSLGSFYNGWLIFYDDIRRPMSVDLIGKLCVVGLADGRVLIKKVSKSRAGRGLYHLHGQTGDPILDTPIEWAARVKGMRERG